MACIAGKGPGDPVLTWGDGFPVTDFRVPWAKMCEASGVSILVHDFRELRFDKGRTIKMTNEDSSTPQN
jgi:hypothetical protein